MEEQQSVFVEPIAYFSDCSECIFRDKCNETYWDGIIPFHVLNNGVCPDEFELDVKTQI